MEIFSRTSPAGRPRVAVVVPRHGRTIVARNRLKRRLREIVRRGWLPGAVGCRRAVDVVVRARPEAYGADFGELRTNLLCGLESISSCDASSSA